MSSEDNPSAALGFPTRELYEFPNIVNVEVYRGDCPCRCVHCPVGMTEPKRRRERFGHRGIDLGLYRKIVQEIAAHSHSLLRIHSVGEPLMWKELGAALELMRDIPVKSWLFTCGITRDKSLLESICARLDIVEVSVNSTSPADYRATKGVDAFAQVYENIEYMHHLIVSHALKTRLIVSRVQSSNRAADVEFTRYWKNSGLVADAFVRSYHTYNDLMPEFGPRPASTPKEPCLVHWARFNINVDGYAVVCFNELFKEHLPSSLLLGDLRERKIAEIWQGTELTALRRAELQNDYSALAFSDALPCKNCSFCQPLRGHRQTSEHQIEQWGHQHAETV